MLFAGYHNHNYVLKKGQGLLDEIRTRLNLKQATYTDCEAERPQQPDGSNVCGYMAGTNAAWPFEEVIANADSYKPGKG